VLAKRKDCEERVAALRALGQIGPAAKEAVPVLLETFKDGYMYQSAAAEALANMGAEAKEAVPKLVAIAQDKEVDQSIREYVREAIVKIDPTPATRLNLAAPRTGLRLSRVPVVKLQSRPALTEAERKEIKSLIAKLAEIDRQ